MSHSHIRSFFLDGPAGKLEAVLNLGAPDPTYAALVCHPHPLYGGTLHNKVVFHTMKALNHFGFPVLRFNFRGTGLSAGEHDFGEGEQGDVLAALDWLRGQFHRPLIFAGFSFGAATGMRVACTAADVEGIVSVGTPFAAEGRLYEYKFLSDCSRPKLFVSGGADQYATRAQLESLVAQTPNSTLQIVEGADHFFAGNLDQLRHQIETWIVNTGFAAAHS